MGELIIIAGPPGAGKSSVSEHLVNEFTPSAVVAGDSFFAMIKNGYLLPWLPQARRQNTVVIEAAAAAAGRLTDICSVIYDGVLGPWFLPTFQQATGLPHINYVILLPPLEVCLERVRGRIGHGFRDPSATRDLHAQFADAAVDTRHLITEPGDHPAQLAELIAPLPPQPAELQRDGVTRSRWCSGLGNVGALTSSEDPCVWLPSRARARRNTKLPVGPARLEPQQTCPGTGGRMRSFLQLLVWATRARARHAKLLPGNARQAALALR